MRKAIKLGAILGSLVGAALIVAIVVWVGVEGILSGGETTALALTLVLIVGQPATLVVGAVAGIAPGRAFGVLYAALVLGVILNWTLIGVAIGWLVHVTRSKLFRDRPQ
jgi:hypothetical protein